MAHSLLLSIIIFLISFFMGKIIQKKYENISNSFSYFLGFILFAIFSSLFYIPFYIILALKQYFGYFFVITISLFLIIFLFNIKNLYISFYFNTKKIFSIILILLSSYLVYYFVFLNKISFELVPNDKPLSESDLNSIKHDDISLWSESIFSIMVFFKFTINDFIYFYNYFIPILMMILITCSIINFFPIEYFFDWKRIFINILLSIFISIIMFNLNHFSKYLFNDSLLYLLIFNSSFFVYRKISYSTLENNIFSYTLFLFFSIILSVNNLTITIILFFIFSLFFFYKKINYSIIYVMKLLVYFLGILSIWFLRFYDFKNAITILYSTIFLVFFIFSYSFYLIYKKNNIYNPKILFWINNKSSFFSSKIMNIYILFIFLFSFISFFMAVYSESPELLFGYLDNILDFNISNEFKNEYNNLLIFFYSAILIFSFFIFIYFKKKDQKTTSNICLFSMICLVCYNPFLFVNVSIWSNLLNNKFVLKFDVLINTIIIFMLSLSIFKLDKFKFEKINGIKSVINFQKNNFYINKNVINITINILLQLSFISCSLFFLLV